MERNKEYNFVLEILGNKKDIMKIKDIIIKSDKRRYIINKNKDKNMFKSDNIQSIKELFMKISKDNINITFKLTYKKRGGNTEYIMYINNGKIEE